ncbi:MAG: IPT/TIG domain-containing protein [Chryseolinea sp.]
MNQLKLKVVVCQAVLLLAVACSDEKSINPIPVLAVTTIAPAVGVAGTTVTITGTGFSPTPTDNHITFNGTTAAIAAATTTQLTSIVPIGATTGAISVETNGKVATGPIFTVTLVSTPVITGIAPASGKASTPITITGENFGTDITAVKVFFNDKEAVILTITNTTITTTIPSKAGSGVVKMIMKGITYPGPAFLYQTSLTVTTLAGSAISAFQDGQGASARFSSNLHVTTDSKGNIYVVDEGNDRIRKITPAGMVSTFAGDGNELHDIGHPNGICVDGDDNVYVSEIYGIIKKITPTGSVSVLSGGFEGVGHADGTREKAKFYYPYGLVSDKINNIYVSEISNYDIRKIDPSGNVITFAGGTAGDENGTGTLAKFTSPHSMAIDESGTLYLADFGSFKIKKITSSGEVSTFVGSTQGHQDGVGVAAKMKYVNAICRDPQSGNMYFGENEIPGDSVFIRMITPLGEVKTLIGNVNGHADGSEETAKFGSILGIACDPNGIIYVSEERMIRKIVIE